MIIFDDKDAGLRDAHRVREFGHHLVEARYLLRPHLTGPMQAQHQAVGEEVGAEVERNRKERKSIQVARTECAAHSDEHRRQRPEEQDRLDLIVPPSHRCASLRCGSCKLAAQPNISNQHVFRGGARVQSR